MVATGSRRWSAARPSTGGIVGRPAPRSDPAGFLWLGLVVVIATPIVRVAVSSVGFAREGQWRMVAVGLGILAIILVGIVSSIAVEH